MKCCMLIRDSWSNFRWWFPSSYSSSTHLDNENGKFSTLSASSHGSLSSITTTSIASSDDPKGGDDDNGNGFDRKTSKSGAPIKQEEWWKTTLQVSIPFLIAGIGTIGAGIVLGRVEVIINLNFSRLKTKLASSIRSFDCYCPVVRQISFSINLFLLRSKVVEILFGVAKYLIYKPWKSNIRLFCLSYCSGYGANYNRIHTSQTFKNVQANRSNEIDIDIIVWK